MEAKINIAEILKDKPTGISLWSMTLAKCTLQGVDNNGAYSVCVRSKNTGDLASYSYKGRWNEGIEDSECVLFPSKEMRDWSKFAWKKGDVLVNKDRDTHVIFEEFTDDTYTTFTGKHYRSKISKNGYEYVRECSCATEEFTLEAENSAQTYINTIEKRLGGKLNRETLEIEKTQPEFKDGDIVVSNSGSIVLFKEIKCGERVYYHACMINGNVYVKGTEDEYYGFVSDIDRLATDTEKLQFFDALAKKGKLWDVGQKQIVDLKPNIELKPFDKVLIRDFESQAWQVSFFGYKDRDSCYCCNGCSWNQCIPYIGNESLLGTTKDVEG